MINWKELLDTLRRCDAQITDYGHPAGQVMFDPAIGVGERIEWETFSLLREEKLIATEDQGRIKRYRISDVGITRLTEVESHQFESNLKALATSVG